MKKKHVVMMVLMLLAVTLFGVHSLDTEAASKTTTGKKVYKAITSVKSGKYTYYMMEKLFIVKMQRVKKRNYLNIRRMAALF